MLTVFPVPLGPRIRVRGVKNVITCFSFSSGPKLRMPCILIFSILDILNGFFLLQTQTKIGIKIVLKKTCFSTAKNKGGDIITV